MTEPRITLAMLKGACREQQAIFRKEWPTGAVATIENVRRAQQLGLDLSWGTKWFIAPASKAYAEASVTASKAFAEASAPAWLNAFLDSQGGQ